MSSQSVLFWRFYCNMIPISISIRIVFRASSNLITKVTYEGYYLYYLGTPLAPYIPWALGLQYCREFSFFYFGNQMIQCDAKFVCEILRISIFQSLFSCQPAADQCTPGHGGKPCTSLFNNHTRIYNI